MQPLLQSICSRTIHQFRICDFCYMSRVNVTRRGTNNNKPLSVPDSSQHEVSKEANTKRQFWIWLWQVTDATAVGSSNLVFKIYHQKKIKTQHFYWCNILLEECISAVEPIMALGIQLHIVWEEVESVNVPSCLQGLSLKIMAVVGVKSLKAL